MLRYLEWSGTCCCTATCAALPCLSSTYPARHLKTPHRGHMAVLSLIHFPYLSSTAPKTKRGRKVVCIVYVLDVKTCKFMEAHFVSKIRWSIAVVIVFLRVAH